MQISEAPSTITDLDLMKRLAAYGEGLESYLEEAEIGPHSRQACRALHSMLASLEKTLGPLLDKVTAREMNTFTAHDRKHSLKVAHIMWHIIAPSRRLRLTPVEIGLLVSASFIHDLGMFLSNSERESRLCSDSDLWDRIDISQSLKQRFDVLRLELRAASGDKQQFLSRKLIQAEEALLCEDNRERHATLERYEKLIAEIRGFHNADPIGVIDLDVAMSFEGDSFLAKLLDICVSHNEPAESLARRDPQSIGRPRFPRDYPVGSTSADLLFVAAVLRLADILDFDRERTPSVLYHYFLPTSLSSEEDKSVLEWSKHLSISNWHIYPNEIVFKGRCEDHVTHHGIVHFCDVIAEEISSTLTLFETVGEDGYPFAIPSVVRADIHSEGYTYVPYRFELDDERVYSLLMGDAIYNNSMQPIRELIQNAVDACCLRDALTKASDPGMMPSADNRIVVRFKEVGEGRSSPVIEVQDTGTGMDEWAIRNWLLKVGRSFYSSSEFNKIRVKLRREGLDFAPVSEFGIGFLSSFLIADKVIVETAMWDQVRGDTQKRTLEIHGPTRLIRLSADENSGASRFRGTKITLVLNRGPEERGRFLSWCVVKSYLERNCLALPYRLHLQHIEPGSVENCFIDPKPLLVEISEDLLEHAVRIPVDDDSAGVKGEIVLVNPKQARDAELVVAQKLAVEILDDGPSARHDHRESDLVRGGFRIGDVPGLPSTYYSHQACKATIALGWKAAVGRRYPLTNLSRTRLAGESRISAAVVKGWMGWLLKNLDTLPEGLMHRFSMRNGVSLDDAFWLEDFGAHKVYRLLANGWHAQLRDRGVVQASIEEWECSQGKALSKSFFSDECHSVLQDLVLPKVCRLEMGPQKSFYLAPPVEGWIDILNGWSDFVRAPVTWGHYVRYIGNIEHLLFYHYTGSTRLNSRYRERIEALFSESELLELINGLDSLAANKQERQVRLSKVSLGILHRAQEGLGDLEIGELFNRWELNTFKLPSRASE